jgi:ribonuclease Z
VIYDDKSVKITTLPLKHRVPSSGFLFEEKPTERHLVKKMLDAYEVPMAQYRAIKNGADYVTPEGEVVPNHRLTTDPTPPKRFAYMSDTAYTEKHLDLIHGVDCLYHESTFLKDDIARIKATLHSSAEQAAMLAKKAEVKQLIIGHYSARYTDRQVFLDEARTVFENTFAAHDGATYFF